MNLEEVIRLYEDVPLSLIFNLTTTNVSLKEILSWKVGDVIETHKSVGEYIDIKIENQPFGNSEVIVMDEKFAMRIISIHTKESLMKLNIR